MLVLVPLALTLEGLANVLLVGAGINNLVALQDDLNLAAHLCELYGVGKEVQQQLLVPALVPINLLEVTQMRWVN